MTFQLVNYSKFNNFYENTLLNHFLIQKRDYKTVLEFKNASNNLKIKKCIPNENSTPIGMSGSYGVSGPVGMSGPMGVTGPVGMSGPMGMSGPTHNNINYYWKNGSNNINNIIEPFDYKFYNSNGYLNGNFTFGNYNNVINTDLKIISGPLGPTGPSGPSFISSVYNYHTQGVNGPNGPINNFNNKFYVN